MKKLVFIVLAVLLVFAVSCGASTTKEPDAVTEAPATSIPEETPADTSSIPEAPDATTEAPATSDGIAVGSDTDDRPWGDPHFPI
jgi:hypothetical protein